MGKNKIDFAINFAAVAFDKSGKKYRKGTDSPYITYPFAVAVILLKAGYSDEVIIAGILHDVLEDTNISIEEIKKELGDEIAKIVNACSENKSLSWKKRKTHTIETLKNLSLEDRAVICADKLHNIRSIVKEWEEKGEKLWEKFNADKKEQKWYYRSIADELFRLAKDKEGNSVFKKLQEETENFFDKI